MANVVTFGEAMIRLSPPGHQRFEQARSFEVEIGGAELNCGVGLARLGHHVDWISVLPRNPLGSLIRNRVREARVNDRFVQFSDFGRCGLNFFENGATPRASEVIYDRAQSSVSLMTPSTFSWEDIFNTANWFHITGITPALSESAANTTQTAITEAKNQGIKISFDLNYRSKLWPLDKAAKTLENLIPQIDLLLATEGDAKQLFGIAGSSFVDVASQISDRFQIQKIASLRREGVGTNDERLSAVVWEKNTLFESKWHPLDTVDRIGSGDAFAAGLIHGLLQNQTQYGVEMGAAFAAIKQTIPGDLPLASQEEIEALISGTTMRVKR